MEFPDGAIKLYTATFSQKMYPQIDVDGYSHTILNLIIDYTNNNKVVPKYYKYSMNHYDNQRLRNMNVGGKLIFQWKYDTEQWVTLKLFK